MQEALLFTFTFTRPKISEWINDNKRFACLDFPSGFILPEEAMLTSLEGDLNVYKNQLATLGDDE